MSDSPGSIREALHLQSRTIRQTLRDERDRLLRERAAIENKIIGLEMALTIIAQEDLEDGDEPQEPELRKVPLLRGQP